MSWFGVNCLKVGVSIALVFDAFWFIRFAVSHIITKCCRSKIKSILDESYVYSMCSTNDLDFNLHMNNARYFRELDFGRIDFWMRSGLYGAIKDLRSNAYVVQHASTIRFRRPITFLLPFIIRTKLIWWDSRSLYFEQRIESLTDGFIKAIAYSRSTIVNSDAELLLEKYMKIHGKGKTEITKPELREDVKAWLDFISMNSKFLAEERIVSE